MKLQFLGTAAFEGIPALFCQCELCKKSKEEKGKNIRSRTSVLIDKELKIDFPPDTYYHMLRDQIDLDQVKDILFTHSHSDHLYAEDLVARLPGYSQTGNDFIHVYGNDVTIDKCIQIFGSEEAAREKFKMHKVKPFESIELRTSTVVPLPASHDPSETCLIYYIEKDDKTILYGHDSGWFPDETWEWLKTKKLDLAILECTVGHTNSRTNHMNIDGVIETKSRFKQYDMLNVNSQIVVTHFSHNAKLMHNELCDIFAPHQIKVAFDGMILNI